jgi:hypothetical protein
MSVTDRQPAVIDVSGSVELTELLRTLEQAPAVREKILGVPVDTVCIDTIDQLARILIEERLSDQRKETMAIQDWGWLGDQLRGIVRGFRNLPMHVIMNCHVKSQEDSDTGKVTYKPAIQGAMGDEIAGYVDLAVLLTARPRTVVKNGQNIRELARIMQTFPDAQHPWIKDRSGKLPMEFTIDLDTDFKRLDALVFADLPAEAPEVKGPRRKRRPPPRRRPTRRRAQRRPLRLLRARSCRCSPKPLRRPLRRLRWLLRRPQSPKRSPSPKLQPKPHRNRKPPLRRLRLPLPKLLSLPLPRHPRSPSPNPSPPPPKKAFLLRERSPKRPTKPHPRATSPPGRPATPARERSKPRTRPICRSSVSASTSAASASRSARRRSSRTRHRVGAFP